MRRTAMAFAVYCLAALAVGCAAQGKYHDTALPDPKGFNAHFGDMDKSGEGKVSWQEFKAYFPKADPKVFSAVDLNKDGFIDNDEWQKFKEAHGF
jgi:Ca2+-binding EF-hand superfamily protein